MSPIKTTKAAKPKTGKSKRAPKKGPRDIARTPLARRVFCDCIAASFRTVKWGTPSVKLIVSQGFTILTVQVPVKFRFTCKNANAEERCLAILTPMLVKADFGTRTVVSAGTGGTPYHGGVCDGKSTPTDSAVGFVVVLREEHPKVTGRLDLRFTVRGCGTVTPWDMSLLIRDGKLDEGESDYDGDGKPNSEERRGREWDPNR